MDGDANEGGKSIVGKTITEDLCADHNLDLQKNQSQRKAEWMMLLEFGDRLAATLYLIVSISNVVFLLIAYKQEDYSL